MNRLSSFTECLVALQVEADRVKRLAAMPEQTAAERLKSTCDKIAAELGLASYAPGSSVDNSEATN